MKNIIAICIAGLFISSAFGAVALQNNDLATEGNGNQGKRDYTHTVFVEVATSQACGPCHYWNQALHNAYISGSYDFEYVEMIVYDHNWVVLNNAALSWNNLFGISAYPTSEFDGGYLTIVGNAPGQLPGVLNTCGARTVANIQPSITIAWLGSSAISVNIQIQNNGQTQYNGYIRVPITEVVSRYTTAGNSNYHFGFLDYAFPMNQAISIAPSGTYTNSVTWVGSQHQDNHGQNFGDIVPGNIQVALAVFNSGNNYLDGTAVAIIQVPPNTPSNPNPTNGATGVDINADLSWAGGDPNPHDTVTYDVYFGTTSPPPKVSSNQSSTTYNPGTLNLLTTYYWKIVAWDNHGASTAGPIWQFTTRANHPPNTPSNPHPTNGATGVPINSLLSWTGGDPDSGDTVTYNVYFGTTNPPPKVANNQSASTYNPGTMNYYTVYYWKIVSFDSLGLSAEGPVWHFTTGTLNTAPTKPTITGPPQGKPGKTYTYVFIATDPEQDNVYYFVDWGDNTTAQWNGPYASGTQVSLNHTWSAKGSYTIKAKAKDVHDAESDWGTLPIKMPINFSLPHPHFLLEFLHRILARFPLLERLFIH